MDSSDDDFGSYENDEMQTYNFICFMCDCSFNLVENIFTHVLNIHGINIINILKSANISDEYDWIKIINFIRKNCNSLNVQDILNEKWKSDVYLKPVIFDDNLLSIDYHSILQTKLSENNDKITELENTISTLEHTVSMLRKKLNEFLDCEKCDNDELIVNSSNTKTTNLNAEDNAYFTGYSHYSIHDIMIKDTVRTESYRKFIEENGSNYFKDKIVLDVGCGTGILSMFAARSGAAHVYGVDCADIIYDAMEIVQKNGFQDKITLIHGKLEETNLPCDQVDVVISEWMGYFLIYESMLDSVLFACRKYLNPTTGLVFPRYFTLNIVGADMSTYRARNVDCWASVFGFDMSCMRMNVMKEVIVDTVPAGDVITAEFLIREYDVQKMIFDADSVCPQVIEKPFELIVTKSGQLGAVVAYFDTYFTSPTESPNNTVMFSTSPAATSTHWQQTVLLLNNPIHVIEGQTINGILKVCRHHHGKRGLNFCLTIGETSQNYEFS